MYITTVLSNGYYVASTVISSPITWVGLGALVLFIGAAYLISTRNPQKEVAPPSQPPLPDPQNRTPFNELLQKIIEPAPAQEPLVLSVLLDKVPLLKKELQKLSCSKPETVEGSQDPEIIKILEQIAGINASSNTDAEYDAHREAVNCATLATTPTKLQPLIYQLEYAVQALREQLTLCYIDRENCIFTRASHLMKDILDFSNKAQCILSVQSMYKDGKPTDFSQLIAHELPRDMMENLLPENPTVEEATLQSHLNFLKAAAPLTRNQSRSFVHFTARILHKQLRCQTENIVEFEQKFWEFWSTQTKETRDKLTVMLELKTQSFDKGAGAYLDKLAAERDADKLNKTVEQIWEMRTPTMELYSWIFDHANSFPEKKPPKYFRVAVFNALTSKDNSLFNDESLRKSIFCDEGLKTVFGDRLERVIQNTKQALPSNQSLEDYLEQMSTKLVTLPSTIEA